MPDSRWQYETSFFARMSEATISFDCHQGKSMSFSYETTSVFAFTRANAASSEPKRSHGSERSIERVMCR